MSFEEFKQLIKGGNERFIFVENGKPEFVLLSFADYKAIIQANSHQQQMDWSNPLKDSEEPKFDEMPFDDDDDIEDDEKGIEEEMPESIEGSDESKAEEIFPMNMGDIDDVPGEIKMEPKEEETFQSESESEEEKKELTLEDLPF